MEALKHSIELRPHFVAYGDLGAAYFYLRRYTDSEASYRQALKIDPNDWQNWGNLGDTLFQTPMRRAEAREAYQKAIDLAVARLQVNPRDANVLAFCADYHAMLDHERLAKEQLAQALQLAPADADVLFRAAILYNHFGNAEKTLDYLAKSLATGYSLTVIRATPDFDHLASDARFRERILKLK
jgi:tetratricopeptide (TPR) repeat protein